MGFYFSIIIFEFNIFTLLRQLYSLIAILIQRFNFYADLKDSNVEIFGKSIVLSLSLSLSLSLLSIINLPVFLYNIFLIHKLDIFSLFSQPKILMPVDIYFMISLILTGNFMSLELIFLAKSFVITAAR